MILYFILVVIAYTSSTIEAMNPVVILKDNQNNIAAITDAKTLQELQTLSTTLAQRPLEEVIEENQKKLVVLTGLPKKLINFLLQLNANKDLNRIFNALNSQAISLSDITRSDINTIGLSQDLKRIFDDLLVIETTQDNLYVSLKKKIITSFFTTIDNLAKDFEDQFIIPIGTITKTDLVNLYMLVYNLPAEVNSLLEWQKNVEFIIYKTREKGLTDLLALLEAANFLGAKSFVLAGLYQAYKSRFKIADWQQQIKAHPILEDILYEIEQNDNFPSIEQLLKKGKTDFYSIKMEKSGIINQDILTARIKGQSVYFLTGLNLIPGIIDCNALYVEDTQMVSLKSNDLDKLNNLKEIVFLDNKNLRVLEKNSLRKFDVRFLKIKGNNITSLSPDVFILSQLKYLHFQDNHLKIIQANWALEIPNLDRLILEEPELTILEPGWLNGLQKLNFLEISPLINSTIQAQIKNDIKLTKIELIMPGVL